MPAKKPSSPVSLEGERRKAMMLVHAVEKMIIRFKERYFRKPHNRFSSDTDDYITFVIEKTGSIKKPPKDYKDFAVMANKVRTSSALLFRNELEQMDEAIERQRMFDELITSAIANINEALENHVVKFCLSFAPEANGFDIKCVQEYENSINRWQCAINNSKNLLSDILKSLQEQASIQFVNYIKNYSQILHYMGLALEVFPRIFNPIKDWVTADEAYPRRLMDEVSAYEKRKLEIADLSRRQYHRMEDAMQKANRKTYQSKKLHDRLYSALSERKMHRRRELILKDSLNRLEEELAEKKKDMEEAVQNVYHRQTTSRGTYDHLVSVTEALQQDISKLKTSLENLRWKLAQIRKERYALQKEIHRLQVVLERSVKQESHMHESAQTKTDEVGNTAGEHKDLDAGIEILRRIRAIKMHPNTVKKIHNEGYTPGAKIDVTDRLSEAFKLAAPDIGKNWAHFYQQLPFRPPRDYDARSHDIELIDLTSQRHDLGLGATVVKSLEKWKRLSNTASVTSLIDTLNASMKTATAKKIHRTLLSTN
ncbi:uncharacterized protein LOC121368187 [Gigantopelta aegis]|uniref:uncharacterized protein LOC121368187 n=1 Tax=Gigantopelta aegis TaxID=1735272 RepID=UPI001B8891DB|nr:uncharacterized protein LOC121368187 [Gigantopelta aegis]XP_041348751.1 uncharacterized protein LOC121368187 [Gigantopelta aegis]